MGPGAPEMRWRSKIRSPAFSASLLRGYQRLSAAAENFSRIFGKIEGIQALPSLTNSKVYLLF
jgi:hypothetical protein